MSCSRPIRAYRSPLGGVSFADRGGESLDLPCGKCELCARRRCSDWSVRLQLEACLHVQSASVCLTYADEFLPPGGVSVPEIQGFHKRLREVARWQWGQCFRFDLISEYSPPPAWRPHYHAIYFGMWPLDAVPWGTSGSGHREYTSETLTRLWGKGRVTFQAFSAGAASYVAGHQASKRRGRKPLVLVDPDTGEVLRELAPEFHLCSNRPGIGAGAHLAALDQALALDFSMGAGGVQSAVPRYFDKLSKRHAPAAFADVVEARVLAGLERRALDPSSSTPERLEAREECARLERQRLKREGVK